MAARREARAHRGRSVWRAADADSCAVVVDVAGPVPLAVDGARLAALASGQPAPLPQEDPDVRAAAAAAAGEPDGHRVRLAAGPTGRDLEIQLSLAPGWAPAAARERLSQLRSAVMAELGERVRRGVALVVVPRSRRRGMAPCRQPRAHGRICTMLRWLTAGESHGRALVAICEGLPAGVRGDHGRYRGRAGAETGRVRPRRADEIRAGRGRDHRRGPARPNAGRPGRHPDRQHRVAEVGDGDVGRPGARRRPGGPGPERPADPAPARPRRPGRHAEIRARRRAAGPGARERPRNGRPGGAR